MKGMALEIIFKWVLALIIGLIVIGMILFFSDEIKQFLKNVFQTDGTEGAVNIESSSFSTSQVKTFIKACWEKYHGYTKKAICYVLKGDVSGVNSADLSNAIGTGYVDTTKFDSSKAVTLVKSTGKGILVESLA